MKAATIRHTTCEKEFVEKSIKNGIRLDGRQAYDYRNIEIKFGIDYGCCEVVLGDTRVLAQTSCEMVKPVDSRPTDGQLFLNVDLSPMASPAFESGRMTIEGIEINRLVERVLKESRPIDTESLCVLAGEKVWSVRVDILVLNNAGNILDCCCIAAISALAHFRRPDVTVSGHDVTIHTFEEKEAVPLNVHHMPLCVTFGFIGDGQQIIIDPEEKEESIIEGKLIMAFNVHNELCCAQMSGGVCLDYEQLLQCANMAAVKASEITTILKEALEIDQSQRAPDPIIKRGLKTPIKPRDFITKTTAEPTESSIAMNAERDEIAIISEKPKEISEYLGNGTSSIGVGGKNAWLMEDPSDEEMSDQSKLEHKPQENKELCEADGDNNSEEEDVVVLSGNILVGKASSNQREATTDDINMKIDDDNATKNNDTANADVVKKNTKKKRRKKKGANDS